MTTCSGCTQLNKHEHVSESVLLLIIELMVTKCLVENTEPLNDDSTSFEDVAKFRYFVRTVTNQNLFNEK
jgi:hypothetical protein